jgi:hypothetical protein
MTSLGQNIFFTDQGIMGIDQQEAMNANGNNQNIDEAELKFMHFIQETQERNVYIYR